MTDLLKLDPRRLDPRQIVPLNRQQGSSLLGLSIDGGRLEMVALRRTNGSVEVRNSSAVSLSLDPLTDDPALVGREIRKQFEAGGIRERRCAVCIPLSWALTLTVKLPDLPEDDLKSFLQIEAERGLPYSPETLMISQSRYRTPAGESYAMIVGVPRDHVARLEAALRAAQLRPISFSLGITAMQWPDPDSTQGCITLLPAENHVGLQVSCDGGVAVLRTIEGAFEMEGATKQVQADQVAREIRITLGQLPSDIRESLRRVQVFGRNDTAEELVEQLGPRVHSLGIKVEHVRTYGATELGVHLPADTPISPALSLALQHLAGRRSDFEFLPPKVSAWKQFSTRYASRKLVSAGIAAGAVALMILLALLFQQWQLARWGGKWAAIKPRVTELETMQQEIKRFRPWYDESHRSLTVLRCLTEAFPEDGAVTAKTIEIREHAAVTCSGTALDHQALLKMLDKLRAAKEVSDVQVEQIRGRSPMQFTFNFHWSERGGQ